MKSVKLALLYGFLVWVLPFAVAFMIFPLRTSDRLFFESIMPVAVTLAVVIFSLLYFKKLDGNFSKEGLLLGLIWLAISIGIDLLMFSGGPMKMGFTDYMKDIGFTYLIIPIVTVGFGLLNRNNKATL
jgi:hypothetical protein